MRGDILERFREIRERLLELAEDNKDIKAVIEIGSQACLDQPADRYSDLDVILAAGQPERYLYSDGELDRLGEIMISFVEPTLGGAMERRMLLEGSLDVDLVVIPPQRLESAIASGELAAVTGRGFRVLLDRMGINDLLSDGAGAAAWEMPSGVEYGNMVNDYWFHIVWAAKKLRRGEIFTAVTCMDGYLARLLLRMTELYEKCRRGERHDVWHNGRLLERWAGEDVTRGLEGCFARYDKEDIAAALQASARLSGRMARACGAALAYPYPEKAEAYAKKALEELLAGP